MMTCSEGPKLEVWGVTDAATSAKELNAKLSCDKRINRINLPRSGPEDVPSSPTLLVLSLHALGVSTRIRTVPPVATQGGN